MSYPQILQNGELGPSHLSVTTLDCQGNALSQCLLQIGDEVIGIFHADTKADKGVRYAGLQPLFAGNAGVRHGGGVAHQGFNATKGFRQGEEFARAEEFEGIGLLVSFDGEAHHTPEIAHLALGHSMVFCVWIAQANKTRSILGCFTNHSAIARPLELWRFHAQV
jgi:hypothetical protein